MNNSLNQQPSVTQQQSGFLASLLNWVTKLIQLTEEEQWDAGIYLGK